MLDPSEQEISLIDIQKRVESWQSLVPHCVTMGYNNGIHSFRNNGTLSSLL